MLLNQRERQHHFEPVFWGYKPDWWRKAMLINARGEKAATGRMLKPLWQYVRAQVPANCWFESARTNEGNQPYFIYQRSRQPLFFAAIAKAPFSQGHDHEGFVIVTAKTNQGMVDIHDRRPLVLQPDSVREWLNKDTSSERASEIAHKCALPESDFDWHKVDNSVGNIHNQGKVLTEPV